MMGENPAQSEADSKKSLELLANLEFLIAQDILMTKTCDMADVVLPSSASWCEADGGTVTNSERRVQRMRKALDPPGQARDDHWIICDLACRLGDDWGQPTLEQVWDELRSLSPMHRGMSYARLEELGDCSGRVRARIIPARPFCTDGCGRSRLRGRWLPSRSLSWTPPIDELNDQFPIPPDDRPAA